MRLIVSGAVIVAALSFLAVGCSSANTGTASTATFTAQGRSLPVSVQSDAQMRNAGNRGPSSSVLKPSSCVATAKSATARGTYAGGLAQAVWSRYGDVIDLYVFSGKGIQLADEPFTRQAPFIGGRGPWTVTVPVDSSLGRPARCMVAAQPTMDFQGAP